MHSMHMIQIFYRKTGIVLFHVDSFLMRLTFSSVSNALVLFFSHFICEFLKPSLNDLPWTDSSRLFPGFYSLASFYA